MEIAQFDNITSLKRQKKNIENMFWALCNKKVPMAKVPMACWEPHKCWVMKECTEVLLEIRLG
jgi:hypothetical protein